MIRNKGEWVNNQEPKLYTIWRSMKQRCYNRNHKYFPLYGGRGILISKDWLDFKEFQKDMLESYKKGLTLERINNNLGYFKGNCRWATHKEQAQNRRSNVYIKHGNKKQTIKEWADEIGINFSTLWMRIYKRNWSIERALNKPAYDLLTRQV